jgi:hypothetical protein
MTTRHVTTDAGVSGLKEAIKIVKAAAEGDVLKMNELLKENNARKGAQLGFAPLIIAATTNNVAAISKVLRYSIILLYTRFLVLWDLRLHSECEVANVFGQ